MDIASNGHHRGNRAKTIVGAALAVIAASTAIIGVDIASFMNTQASLDAQYSETPIISSIRSGYSWKVSNAVYRSVADTDPIVRYSADRNIPENLPSYPVSASVAHEHGSVEFVDSSSIESLDSSYPPPHSGDNLDFEPVLTDKSIRVKFTFIDHALVNADGVPNPLTISSIWSDETGYLAGRLVFGQHETYTQVYEISGDDSCYVVKATGTGDAPSSDVIDALAVLDSSTGTTIDGVVYDKETGLVYIPKSVLDSPYCDAMQLQFLQLVDLSGTDCVINAVIDNRSPQTGIESEEVNIDTDVFENSVEIPLGEHADIEDLELDDIAVLVNALPFELRDDMAILDKENNTLILLVPPNGIESLYVKILPEGVLADISDMLFPVEVAHAKNYTINDGDIRFYYNGNTYFDQLSPNDVKAGQSFTYNAQMMYKKGTSTDSAQYGKGTGRSSTSTDDLTDKIRRNAGWDSIRTSKSPWYNLNGKRGMMQADGPFNKTISGKNFHIQGASSRLVLECSHTSSPVGNAGDREPGSWFSSRCFMRVLKVVDNGNWSYMICGFVTPMTNSQSCTGIYKFRMQGGGNIEIRKRAQGSSPRNIASGAAVANARFGIYEDASCTRLRTIVSTGSNGNALISNIATGTYYVHELSAPWPYYPNPQTFTVSVQNEKTAIVNVIDQTYGVLQIKKYKRPQLGTFTTAASHFPAKDSPYIVSAQATVSGANNAISYKIDIVKDENTVNNEGGMDGGSDGQPVSLSIEIPSEITLNGTPSVTDGMSISISGRTITASDISANATISFTGTVKQGWAASATSAVLATVNSRGASDCKSILSAPLPKTDMNGAQYTIYADKNCQIPVGSYNIWSKMDDTNTFRLSSMTSVAGQPVHAIIPEHKAINYNWRVRSNANGTTSLVNTATNFALDFQNGQINTSVVTRVPNFGTSQQWILSADDSSSYYTLTGNGTGRIMSNYEDNFVFDSELPPLARGAEVEASPLLRVLRSLGGVVLDLISILERILNVFIGKSRLEQVREPRVHSRHH